MLRDIARRICHMPGLEQQDWIWNLVRRRYHKALNIRGSGTSILVGGEIYVRIPPEYSGGDWETYEPESIGALVSWARKNPGGLVLDVGCAMGIFSAAALFAEPSIRVIAFDSDLPSLAATLRVCRYPSGTRIRPVYGLISNESSDSIGLDQAIVQTQALLAEKNPTGDVATTRYITLGCEEARAVPKHALDKLFPGNTREKALFLKCDVEGAELHVLRGAMNLIARTQPSLLLSVHPEALFWTMAIPLRKSRNFCVKWAIDGT